MKVAVLIMSANNELCSRNKKGMINSFIDECEMMMNSGKAKHEYDFIFYSGDENLGIEYKCENVYDNYTIDLLVNCEDHIYRTFEKTYKAFDFILKNDKKYDWIVRLNISAFLNVQLLDRVLEFFNKDTIYCNALNSIISDVTYLNDIYARGDMFIISTDMIKKIMPEMKKLLYCDTFTKNRLDVTHVDDCLIGVSIINTFGQMYYTHYQMLKYNYCPNNNINLSNNELVFSLCSRIKTVPPGINYSGYSWDDNDFRVYDVEKMLNIEKLINEIDFTKYDAKSLFKGMIIPHNNGRPSLFISMKNVPIGTLELIVKTKRKK